MTPCACIGSSAALSGNVGHQGSQYRWRTLGVPDVDEMPMARACTSLVFASPHVYVFGGANIEVGELSDMWRFNLYKAVPQRSTFFGDNVLTATANENAKFEIDARTLFNTPIPECSSDFVVEFQSLQTSAFINGLVKKTQLSGRCSYMVEFNIRKIGLFKMTVSTMGVAILGSPSELNVLPGATNDAMSTAVGEGLSGCTAGLTCTFTILTRDVSGNQGKGGNEVRVIPTGPCTEPLEDPVTQEITTCPGPDTITATHQDANDGSFPVSYTITATGNYSVHIKFDGSDDHIGGSPFRTLVVANDIEPSLSWIYGPGLTYSEAGLSSKFFVQTRGEGQVAGGEGAGAGVRVGESASASGVESEGMGKGTCEISGVSRADCGASRVSCVAIICARASLTALCMRIRHGRHVWQQHLVPGRRRHHAHLLGRLSQPCLQRPQTRRGGVCGGRRRRGRATTDASGRSPGATRGWAV